MEVFCTGKLATHMQEKHARIVNKTCSYSTQSCCVQDHMLLCLSEELLYTTTAS